MILIKKHLITFLVLFVSFAAVGVGASLLGSQKEDSSICEHGSAVVFAKATATCTEDGYSDGVACSFCKKVLQPSREIYNLGHFYKDGTCIRCGGLESEDLEYILSEDGLYYSVAGIGGYKGTDLRIMSKHNDKPVREILAGAFYNNETLTSVTIDRGIWMIEGTAFFGCQISSLSVGEGLIEIGYAAFENCEKLSNVTLPEGLETIGSYAFSNCAFTDFIVPDGVTIVDDGAFSGCSNLTNIAFPESITYIGDAFYGCDALTDVYYPGNRNQWCEVTIESEAILAIFPQEIDNVTGE